MRTLKFCLMASLALATSGELAAQNLILNGQFDTGSEPWTIDGIAPVPAEWQSEDCCGNPASGSIIYGTVFASTLRSSCMPVAGSSEYDFLVMLRLSHVVPNTPGRAMIAVGWFADSNCGTNSIPWTYYEFNTMEYTTAWTRFGTRMTAPIDATHAQLVVSTSSGLSNSTTARLDDVRFGPAGTVPVGLVSFTVD